MLAGGNDRLFGAICDVVGLPELVDDPRFRTNPDRVRNRDELVALLEERLATGGTEEWRERFAAAGVPAAPVADVADVANARQTEALGSSSASTTRGIENLTLAALPLSLDGERALHPSAPPNVGEHSAEILRETRLHGQRDRGARRGRSDQRMSHVSASYSATLRVRLPDAPGSFARVAKAIGDAGGSLDAIDLVRVSGHEKVRDVTVHASSEAHLRAIVDSVQSVEGVEVEHVSDRTFLLHLGGKLEVVPRIPLKTRDDLSMAYTPGVARVCERDRGRPRRRLEPDDQAQHGGGRLRRDGGARPRATSVLRRRCR